MESASTLDIVIPCFNPPNNWAQNLVDNYERLNTRLIITPGIIVVNDGSTKGLTKDDVTLLSEKIERFQYISLKENKGKGAALRAGVSKTKATSIIFTDVDFPYEIDSLLAVYNKLQEGNNVVLGTRNEAYYLKVPFFRKVLSKSFRFAMKVLLRLKSTDTQCGLKGFDQKGKKYFQKTTINRFLFDLEFVHYCSRAKDLQLATEPVQLKEGVEFSKMPLKILVTEGFNFLKVLFKAVFGK